MTAKKSEQRIFRGKHKSHFSILPNALLEHGHLSIEAKGLIAYLLSRPPNWHIRPRQLATKLRIGKDRLQRMMRELIGAGFVVRKRVRKAGMFVGMNYFVHDVPQPEKPALAEPALAEPATVFQADYKEQNVIKKDKEQISSAQARSLRPTNRSEQAARTKRLGNGSMQAEHESIIQSRIAARIGRGNVGEGFRMLQSFTAMELDVVVKSERYRRLSDEQLAVILDRVSARIVLERAAQQP